MDQPACISTMDSPSPTVQAGTSLDMQRLVLCSYRNATNRMVIVRARGAGAFFLERVVFPFEIMTFHCPPAADVEVIRRGVTGREEPESLQVEQLLAADDKGDSQGDWRPQRGARALSVRSNASTICLDGG
jgi:hypothetical protein